MRSKDYTAICELFNSPKTIEMLKAWVIGTSQGTYKHKKSKKKKKGGVPAIDTQDIISP